MASNRFSRDIGCCGIRMTPCPEALGATALLVEEAPKLSLEAMVRNLTPQEVKFTLVL